MKATHASTRKCIHGHGDNWCGCGDCKVARCHRREIHIRKNPDDACAKPVWCGETGVASITEAWGFYGPGGDGHDDVCRACIAAERRDRGGKK